MIGSKKAVFDKSFVKKRIHQSKSVHICSVIRLTVHCALEYLIGISTEILEHFEGGGQQGEYFCISFDQFMP